LPNRQQHHTRQLLAKPSIQHTQHISAVQRSASVASSHRDQ